MKICKKLHSFTLIELIIVIGLIGLFLGVAMPAFTNVSKGRSNSAACTDIAGQLSIARNYAIQNHCYTALIFPRQDELESGLGSIPNKPEILANVGKYYDASVRIAIVTPYYASENASSIKGYRFVMWMPDGHWVIFANNVLIADDKDFPSSHNNKLVDVQVDASLLKLCGKKVTGNSDANLMDVENFIVIKPNGEIIDNDHDPMLIGVTDGYFDIRKKKHVYEKRLQQGTKQYYHGLRIVPFTGRTQQGEYDDLKKLSNND